MISGDEAGVFGCHISRTIKQTCNHCDIRSWGVAQDTRSSKIVEFLVVVVLEREREVVAVPRAEKVVHSVQSTASIYRIVLIKSNPLRVIRCAQDIVPTSGRRLVIRDHITSIYDRIIWRTTRSPPSRIQSSVHCQREDEG